MTTEEEKEKNRQSYIKRKAWFLANREKYNAMRAKRQKENWKVEYLRIKKWHDEHKDQIREYYKKYYQVNKEKIKAQAKVWKEKNRLKVNARARELRAAKKLKEGK